ncbi:MAG: hypothetical protein JJT75_08140 [Opitutales bacterium]|nr:hypothetical protein [Opitutales bacterium]MCH8540805.1 hypothetical protein [Opitutales bacterium]
MHLPKPTQIFRFPAHFVILVGWFVLAVSGKADESLPDAGIIHGGHLVTEDQIEDQEDPYYVLSWTLSDGFESADAPGFWSQWWAAITDWSLSPNEETPDHDWQFQVQRDTDPAFPDPRNVYLGPDTTSYISGMGEETHYFRVRTVSPDGDRYSEWSPSLALVVNYPSQIRAFALFGVGAIVTTATIAMILIGSARTRREAELEERKNRQRDGEAPNS